jgi:hypothetical protein
MVCELIIQDNLSTGGEVELVERWTWMRKMRGFDSLNLGGVKTANKYIRRS